jgi:hypothetical protein
VSFLATTDWAESCSGLWSESLRFSPEPTPRLALTAEQLFQSHPFSPLGTNIFDWNPAEAADRHALRKEFLQHLEVLLDIEGDGLNWSQPCSAAPPPKLGTPREHGIVLASRIGHRFRCADSSK